jgi:hypothetical protein
VHPKGSCSYNALYTALFQGHQEIVKLLLDKGADLNAQGGIYGNALRAASEKGHQDCETAPKKRRYFVVFKAAPSNPMKEFRLINPEPSNQTQ